MFTQKPVQECSLSVLFIITITWKQPKCTSMGEWINKLWNVHTMEHYQAKWMNYWYTWLGWISKALRWMKEANLKRLHVVWLHLYDILYKTKLHWWETDQWLLEIMGGGGGDYQWTVWRSFRVMELFSIPIVVVITWIYMIYNHRIVHPTKNQAILL